MKSMLDHASENNYAVMAVNCVSMEILRAIIDAAEEQHSPIIVNISPRQFKAHAPLELIVPMYTSYAASASVPIALNLDHGQSYEDITKALRLGFTSVMFDGSTLPFEKNIEYTRIIRSLSREYGCSLEAELGHVGVAAEGDDETNALYTDVDEAVQFIQQTQVDCLAVAIGTAHGSYPKGKKPKIDFNRLKELKEALKIPLVLHGGSGAGEENIRRAVQLGINKINVCTDLFNHGREALRTALTETPHIDLMDLQHVSQLAMKDYIKNYIAMIGSSNRYDYDVSKAKALD